MIDIFVRLFARSWVRALLWWNWKVILCGHRKRILLYWFFLPLINICLIYSFVCLFVRVCVALMKLKRLFLWKLKNYVILLSPPFNHCLLDIFVRSFVRTYVTLMKMKSLSLWKLKKYIIMIHLPLINVWLIYSFIRSLVHGFIALMKLIFLIFVDTEKVYYTDFTSL